jgi:hypothetical protein
MVRKIKKGMKVDIKEGAKNGDTSYDILFSS